MIENEHQKEAFQTATTAVAIVAVIIAIIVWFIFWIQSGIETERFKHETCTVVTTYTGETSARVPATITEYCGPNKAAEQ